MDNILVDRAAPQNSLTFYWVIMPGSSLKASAHRINVTGSVGWVVSDRSPAGFAVLG